LLKKSMARVLSAITGTLDARFREPALALLYTLVGVIPRSRLGVGIRVTLPSVSPADLSRPPNIPPNFSEIAAFVFENLSPIGLTANTAPTFSVIATLAFEKLSPDGLLAAKKVPKRVENPDFIEDPLLFAIKGVPLLRFPFLRLLKQKKRRPAIARKEMTPNTAPTTAPGWTLAPPSLLLEWLGSDEEWSEPE
jgi:hypothetical protein